MANSRNRDEGQEEVLRDKDEGGAEAKATPANSEDERDEGRSTQERRVQEEEKKAASPGPSGA